MKKNHFLHKKISISIGIVAHNEDANIKNLINSIREQNESFYSIKEIIVISDGSYDNTVSEIRNIKDFRIKLIEFKQRIGKSKHLNTIFKNVLSSYIVLLDADIILASKNTVGYLIKPMMHNNSIGLIGGNPQPLQSRGFIEETVNTSFRAYSPLRTTLRGGNNIYGCDGRILALSKKFADLVTVPTDMIANDAYLYFSCITKGFTFRHVTQAKVLFRSPSTFKDQIRQNKRFIAAHYRMQRVFGPIAYTEYFIPKLLLYRLQLDQFLKSPLHAATIFLINKYCKIYAITLEKKMDAKWDIAITTKGKIAYE